MLAEGISKLAIGVAKLAFADNKKRRAEFRCKVRNVTIFYPEIAIRSDADELTEIFLVLLRCQVRSQTRCLCVTSHQRFLQSIYDFQRLQSSA